MNEKETYLTRLNAKFANGLQRVNFFASGIRPESEEAMYAEPNHMDNAVDQPDVEVLGRFSP